MATIRERRPGVWEVRSYTGRDREGNPTQVSRTVHGTKRDAQRATAELTVKPARNAGGRKVGQLLDEWLEIKAPSWAPLTVRDQTSRSALIQRDPIASMSVASLGVSDIDRWVARLRKSGAGEASIRNQHTVLRAALQQAVRWEWIATNPASAAPIEQPKRQQKGTLTNEEVRALIEAAAEVHEMAPLAFRLAAETGARRGELAAMRWEKFVDDRVVVDGQNIVSTIDGARAPRLHPTKTGSRRVVTLSPSLAEMVGEKTARYADVTHWLFTPDADPPNPDRIGWWWRRSRKLAGIGDRWRLHDLRHWSATVHRLWPGCPNRRPPPRPRRPSDDAPGVRPRRRASRRSARPDSREHARRVARTSLPS